ncbi:DMT family transporter [Moraxella sp. FZLJ2107]|uniref:DMT family transporter n=1 Tax=unclassified Moraxella TaxID=2685852 RepID=UPI0020C8D136|nr:MULTISPECIES: EamA family transporter [unclassified Moraxella]UTO05960.1 DMT family transporter [Moraxella sp. FZLJ2107]UTO22696.1 DMT family transporter [Moraxella sp. FZLJ2109]
MKTEQSTLLIGSLQVILAGICWGTLGIFSTQLGDLGLTSFQITTLRIVTAGMIVLVLLPKLFTTFAAMPAKQWLGLIIQSLIGVLGMTLCYFYAVGQVGVSMAVALLYTAPVFSLVLARVILGERITAKSALLAIIAVIGVACLMAGDKFTINTGVAVGLLSGLCYSLYGILGKKAMGFNHSAQMVFFSSVAFSSLALLFLPQTFTTYQTVLTLPVQTWGLVLGLSLVGTIAPFLLYMNALQKLPATTASVFTIVEPLTAIILAVFLLHQPLSMMQLIGVVLIIGATLANALGRK